MRTSLPFRPLVIGLTSMTSSSDYRARLHAIIAARSFSNDREITLASGAKSWLYFNMKPTMLDPEGAFLMAELILDRLSDVSASHIGGLEMGAVPIAACVAPASYRRWPDRALRAFLIRKQAKAHGTRARIEGLARDETLKGARVVMVEDVTTTGGSLLDAVRVVRAAGATIVKVITLVDRQEGARQALAAEGLDLTPLFLAQDFTS